MDIPEDYPCTLEVRKQRDGSEREVYCCEFQGHSFEWHGWNKYNFLCLT